MKLLIALMAVAGLSGCVAYGGAPVYGTADVYYSTGSPYYGGYYGTPAPYHGGSRYYRSGPRDQDRDGVPNRYDRDRDGDGVSNRRDAYPGDPRRR